MIRRYRLGLVFRPSVAPFYPSLRGFANSNAPNHLSHQKYCLLDLHVLMYERLVG